VRQLHAVFVVRSSVTVLAPLPRSHVLQAGLMLQGQLLDLRQTQMNDDVQKEVSNGGQ
jgi:hypothetical protein